MNLMLTLQTARLLPFHVYVNMSRTHVVYAYVHLGGCEIAKPPATVQLLIRGTLE